MSKKLIGLTFIFTSIILFIIVCLTYNNYKLTHDVGVAQVAGISGSQEYIVYKDAMMILEDTYKLRVGDKIRVVYDADNQTIEVCALGCYLNMFLISVFSLIIGLLFVFNFNFIMTIMTIIIYTLDVLLLSSYTNGLMAIIGGMQKVNYCKSMLIVLIILNSILVTGYFVNYFRDLHRCIMSTEINTEKSML